MKTIVFDFDGVIHSYTSGWCGPENIPDPPVPGIKDAIASIRAAGYNVHVVSSRAASYKGLHAIDNYLKLHNIVVDGVSDTKVPAILYVDDRAITFDGDSTHLLKAIQEFVPWYERSPHKPLWQVPTPSQKRSGAIISGYQGIGKSSLANTDIQFVDLESGNFWVDGKRPEDWYKAYCNIAVSLAEQGYNVFVSSHSVVREYLSKISGSIKLFTCFPAKTLKEPWIERLRERYAESGLDKDYKAWKNAVYEYDANISDLSTSSKFSPIEIYTMMYSLKHIIEDAIKN